MSARPPLALTAFPLLLAGLAVGCSHYRLGTEGRLAFASLYVEPVQNKVLLPQAQAVVSAELREAFVRDGRVEIVDSPGAADAVLKVVITDYHREMIATRESDIGLASKFAVTLGVTCSLRDTRSGRTYFENRVVSAERDSYTDNGQPSSSLTGDQLQSEYNLVPLLAGSLADKVTHAVLDLW
jgi:hypothetical protein